MDGMHGLFHRRAQIILSCSCRNVTSSSRKSDFCIQVVKGDAVGLYCKCQVRVVRYDNVQLASKLMCRR